MKNIKADDREGRRIRIVEQGSYDELMEKDGLFARFARRNML